MADGRGSGADGVGGVDTHADVHAARAAVSGSCSRCR